MPRAGVGGGRRRLTRLRPCVLQLRSRPFPFSAAPCTPIHPRVLACLPHLLLRCVVAPLPRLQAVNFKFVPVEYQLLVVNLFTIAGGCCRCGWRCYMLGSLEERKQKWHAGACSCPGSSRIDHEPHWTSTPACRRRLHELGARQRRLVPSRVPSAGGAAGSAAGGSRGRRRQLRRRRQGRRRRTEALNIFCAFFLSCILCKLTVHSLGPPVALDAPSGASLRRQVAPGGQSMRRRNSSGGRSAALPACKTFSIALPH